MTKEQAIDLLDNLIGFVEDSHGSDYDQALKMAIKALKQEPSEDCISRQAVLSKIKEVCFSKEWIQFRVDKGSNGQRDFLINYIKQLPSVTPKTDVLDKIMKLQTYKMYEGENTVYVERDDVLAIIDHVTESEE